MKIARKGDNKWVINWPVKAIPKDVFKYVDTEIRATRSFGPTDYTGGFVDRIVKDVGTKFDAKLTIKQVTAIRKIVVKDKIMRGYGRMNAHIAHMSRLYAKNDILTLSMTKNFPPLNLLRGILLHRGIPPSKVYSVFANKTDPAEILSGRDLEQFKIAEEHDAESTFNQRMITAVAADNEIRVVNFFKSQGIGMKTQDDLVAEQVAEHGRAVITPDILFTDEVIINGRRVHWIDYKDYVGTPIKFLAESNLSQAARYVTKWGPGVMLYHYGFVEGFTIPDTQLLDMDGVKVVLL